MNQRHINDKCRRIISGFASAGLAFFLIFNIFLLPEKARAQSVFCNFSRIIFLGSQGEDVRCLQRYLNSARFAVAFSGPGSFGNETTSFGRLTESALFRFQVENQLSPTGIFDFSSQAKYREKIGISEPMAPGFPASSSVLADRALQKIEDAEDELDDAWDEIEDADDDGEDVDNAENIMDDAEDLFTDAVDAYNDRDFDEAKDLAEEVIDEVERALDRLDEDDQELTRAEAVIFTNETIIKFEFDDEAILIITGRTNREDIIEKILDEIDDNDIDEDDVDDVLDIDVENRESRHEDRKFDDDDEDDAEDALEDAEDAIDDARDEIEEADDDGEDVDEAEDLLEEAEDTLDDAWDEFDDEDFDEAIDLAEEAEDLAEEAIDEIGN